jgi:carbon starvation protein
LITRESYARPIGYGAMCLESLVAIMAMIAACTLEPGVYLSMNVKGAGTTQAAIAANTVEKVQAAGFTASIPQMEDLANEMGEKTLFGRTGGAATLAVGMARIFSGAVKGHWADLWYHFALMFEALFILTTLDAGTRVGRYLLQDMLGNLWAPFGDIKNARSNCAASLLVVAGWGYFLIQGVRDPLGGINSLWPLFGIANQLLASIALCLATTIILKMQLARRGHPALALVTFIPLLWLLAVTGTASVQKIFHESPAIGFLSNARGLASKRPALRQAVDAAQSSADPNALAIAQKALRTNEILAFNQYLDAVIAGFFLVLVTMVVVLCVREWLLLLAKRKPPELKESPVAWLPEYAVAEGGSSLRFFGLFALGLGLMKELSGEAALDRMAKQEAVCRAHEAHSLCAERETDPQSETARYIEATEHRFKNIRRCC